MPLVVGDATRRWRLSGSRGDVLANRDGVTHRIVGLRRLDDLDGGSTRGVDIDIDADLDGRAVRALGAVDGDGTHWLADGSELHAIDGRLRGARRDAPAAAGLLLAPMHGRVVETHVVAGASVEPGELLLVIEAMKMEHAVRAPHAGTVAFLHVRRGDQVATRQPLVEVAPVAPQSRA